MIQQEIRMLILKILTEFDKSKPAVLVGTQMIAKGQTLKMLF